MVSEKTRKGATPVIMVAPPAPPPRSTPLQDRIVQQQAPTDSASSPTPRLVDGREWSPSGSEEGSSPQFPNVQQIVHRMSNPTDSPDGTPDVVNRSSTPVKSSMSHDVMDQKTCDDQIVAQGHVRDPSDICETSFDDVTSSEADETEANPPSQPPSESTPETKRDVELHSVKMKQKVAPPVPLRRSSTRTSTHHNSEELTSATTSKDQTHSELKRLPSLKDRKEQLQAKMSDSNPLPPQSSEHVEPGRVVIHEALRGVSPGMPAAQHPLLNKKREDTATKEREEEQGRLSREEKEKAKKRFSFMGSKTKKGKGVDPTTNSKTDPPPSKEQFRRSMSALELDELQNVFKHITLNKLSNPDPDPLPQTHTVREDKDEDQGTLVRDEAVTEKEETDNTGPSLPPPQPVPNNPPSLSQEPLTKPSTPHNHLKSLPEHPMETELASLTSSRPNTLERCTPKPPSSSPPSLPGSIDRRVRRQGNSQNNTLERLSQSRPGSRPGTLERKTPPPPTSQPPPAPTEIRKEHTRTPSMSSIGFNGGRVNLVDVIVGVDRDTLTSLRSVGQSPSTAPSSIPYQSGPINVKRKSIKKRH